MKHLKERTTAEAEATGREAIDAVTPVPDALYQVPLRPA